MTYSTYSTRLSSEAIGRAPLLTMAQQLLTPKESITPTAWGSQILTNAVTNPWVIQHSYQYV